MNDINDQQEIFKSELSKIEIPVEDRIAYKYDDIKSIVGNIKLNWENLNNKERMSFLEQFIKEIKVGKKDDSVVKP